MRLKTTLQVVVMTTLFFASIGGLFAQADLSLSLTQQPATPQQYSLYSITATLSNDGPENATNVVVSIPPGSGIVYQGGNEFSASAGTFSPYGNQTWTLSSLDAGASETITINYFLSVASAPDSYAQVMESDQADPDSSPGNGTPPTVGEDDEASTAINGGFVPDLTLSNLSLLQNPVDSGQQFDYTFDINNIGAGSIAQNFIIQAYISTDATISTDDLQNGTVPTGNFGPGQTVAGVVGASIPVGLSPGNYFLILEADANGQVQESNESNNEIAVPFQIQTAGSTCQIGINSPAIVTCNDNGTPADPSDDRFAVELNVSNGTSTGTYAVQFQGQGILATAAYGNTATFDGGLIGSLAGTDLTYSVVESANPACSNTFTISVPAPCSNGNGGGDIDLSVSISQSPAQPAQYTLYSVTATVANSGSQSATGVVVDLPIPAGVVYEGGNEFTATQGQLRTFGSRAGQWTVGTIPAGQNAEITINYFLRTPTSSDSYVEVLAANEQDVDSTPGNGNGQVNEDDEASTGQAAFPCDLELIIDSVVCNDNGTATASDDFFYVYLVVNSPSRGSGGSYNVGANGTSIPQPAIYGQQYRQFVGIQSTIRQGDSIYIRAFDANDSSCSLFEGFPAPPSCSSTTPCAISATIQSIDCDDQGTANETDDTYSVTFLVENGGASGTWTADNGGANPSFGGSYGVPYSLQGGNIFNTINLGGLTLSINITDDLDASCATSLTWQTPGATCSSSTDPCDAIPAYLASLNDPEKVTVSTDPLGNITVEYLTPSGGTNNFTFNGPAALGVTPVADDIFVARDVVCTPTGFAIVGTYRDIVNPGNQQPFLIQLDAQGNVLHATIPTTTLQFSDLNSFSIIGVVSGPTGDVLITQMFSGGRSYQLVAFDNANTVLWNDQVIGDLVTNRIGGAVISSDQTQIYFSYRDGNSQTWPRLRGVDITNGTTNWEVQLGNLVGSSQTIISGGVSIPISMPNGDVVLGFTARVNGGFAPYAARLDANGNVVFLTQLPPLGSPGGLPYVAQYVHSTGDIVFTGNNTEIVVTGAGVLETCNGGQGIDLELLATSAQAQPAIYDVNSITFTLSNTGTEMATNVFVDVPKPTDVVYTGGNEYTASQGVLSTFGLNTWTVGDIAPGATATLVVNYFSLSATGYTQYAEVEQMDGSDVDSTPGNGNRNSAVEDDEVFLDLTHASNTQALTFFPNPAPQGEQIILDFVSSGEATQTVLFSDLTGRPVHALQVTFQEGRNQIPVDLGSLPSGVYVVAFPESGLAPKRIIIQE